MILSCRFNRQSADKIARSCALLVGRLGLAAYTERVRAVAAGRP